jgi:hypothetical protein
MQILILDTNVKNNAVKTNAMRLPASSLPGIPDDHIVHLS